MWITTGMWEKLVQIHSSSTVFRPQTVSENGTFNIEMFKMFLKQAIKAKNDADMK